MKKPERVSRVAIALSLIFAAFGACAQTRPAAPAVVAVPAQTQSASRAVDLQWEYLVVSYGKTIFGTPEKTLAYRSIGLSATAQEANEVQRSLDVLGRFGWEVVTIVGSIGGDQQIVFKRRFDRARSANEASEILKGREVYLRDLLDIMERESRVREEAAAAAVAERNRPRLIELDEADRAETLMRLSAERKSAVESGFAGMPWGSQVTVKVTAGMSFTRIEAVFDGTQQFLKNGNTYRKSEVDTWVKNNLLRSLESTAKSSDGPVMLSIDTQISFNGAPTKVHELRSTWIPNVGWR
jgi:hypothetical protein